MISVYILDDNFKEYKIIEHYESFIWTDRFDDFGDFELKIEADNTIIQDLREGTVISIEESYRMMMVETVESLSEGNLVFKGRSLETVLASRVGRGVSGASPSAWVTRLAVQALVVGLYDPDDKIHGIQPELGRLFPPSNMPPTMEIASSEGDGWIGLYDAFEQASGISPLGFRIVRKPFTSQLYFQTYTGSDRSDSAHVDFLHIPTLWPNPYFFEVDDSIIVWENLAVNPGFTEGIRPLSPFGDEHDERNNIRPSEVDCDWSMSGKGLLIPSSEDRTGNGTTVNLCADGPNFQDDWIHGPLYGRTFTISAKIQIREIMGGNQSVYARELMAATTVHGTTETFLARMKAPNTVGIHALSITFTLPPKTPDGHNRWSVYVTNGNGNTDEGVIWGDLCVFEHPSNPVGYFDGNYSPDEDLNPIFQPWTSPSGEELHYSVLVGQKIQGIEGEGAVNSVFIQSKLGGRFSARLIRTSANYSVNRYSFLLPKLARYIRVNTRQEEVLTRIAGRTDFKRLELHKNDVSVFVGPTGNNVVGEQLLQATVSGGFDSVTLRGGYTDLGGSIWWDFLVVAENTGWAANHQMIQPVIFSDSLDTFEVDRLHQSIEDYRNVAIVTRGDLVIQVDDGYTGPGLMRRAIHVDAGELSVTPRLRREMELMGRKALIDHRRTSYIDGEVPVYSRYVYDEDYFLGDVVMVQNRLGNRMVARVVEQIFVCDAEGTKKYPTLREEVSVSLGHWNASEYNIHWSSAEPLGTWSDQP